MLAPFASRPASSWTHTALACLCGAWLTTPHPARRSTDPRASFVQNAQHSGVPDAWRTPMDMGAAVEVGASLSHATMLRVRRWQTRSAGSWDCRAFADVVDDVGIPYAFTAVPMRHWHALSQVIASRRAAPYDELFDVLGKLVAASFGTKRTFNQNGIIHGAAWYLVGTSAVRADWGELLHETGRARPRRWPPRPTSGGACGG